MTDDLSLDHPPDSLIEVGATRALLDTLLTNSRLYQTTADYKALLDFVVRLRNFAPFNAMLLQVQKPGLTYAASAADWWGKFGRKPKDGARPLLILWPFGPVALVYDVMDTEGKELPQDVASFFAHGPIGVAEIEGFGSARAARTSCGTMSTRGTERPARSDACGAQRRPVKAPCIECW